MSTSAHTSPKVNVLLSTYNGAAYLPAQLDSIFAQQDANLLIHVRDDGSSDNTVEMLQQYDMQHENLVVRAEANLGVIKSFFDLLQQADDTCKYFAFCDQDDVWVNTKMANAVELLEQESDDVPLLYFCRLEYVDQQLNHIGYGPVPRRLGFGNALVQNLATGCTVVINRKARDMILSQLPRRAMMHDWWAYLVASAYGKVVYDNRIGIKYRQHGGNEVGGTPIFSESMKRRFKRFVNHGKHVFMVSEQAIEFVRCFGDSLPAKQRNMAARFLASKKNFFARLRYAFSMDVWRNTVIDHFILRIMILIDRY